MSIAPTRINPIITPITQTIIYNGSTSVVQITANSTSPGVLTYSLALGYPLGTTITTSGLLTINGIGTILVYVTQAGSTGYFPITLNTLANTITVKYPDPVITPITQTITYGSTSTVQVTTISTSPGALTYSLASGYPLGTTITSSGFVTIGSAGIIKVNATQAASGNWSSITSLVYTINVTVIPPGTPTLGITNKIINYIPTTTLNTTSTSPGAITYSLASGPTGTVVTSAGVVTIGGIGTINVNVSQAATTNWTSMTGTQVITVYGINPIITPAASQFIQYGSSPLNIVATSTSPGLLTYSLASGPTGTSVTSAGVLTIGNIGTITINVSQGATGNYNAITNPVAAGIIYVTGNNTPIIIPASNQTIPSFTVGSTTTITATSNSPGTLIYSLGLGMPSGTTINSSTGVVTIGGYGVINVYVTQNASGNYNAILTPILVCTITVGIPIITPAATQYINYFLGATVQVNATSTSSGAFTYLLASGPTGTSVTSAGAVTIGGVGTIIINATQAAYGNYTAITFPLLAGTIIVNPGSPIIIPFATKYIPYSSGGSTILNAISQSTGLLSYYINTSTSTSTSTSLSGTSSTLSLGNVGTINFTVTQLSSNNWNAITTRTNVGTIIITPVMPVITPVPTQIIAYNSSNPYFNAPTLMTVPSFTNSIGALSYTLTCSTGSIGSIVSSSGLVTIGSIGTFNIYVTQQSTTNYSAITTPTLAQTIIVIPGITPVITAVATQTYRLSRTTAMANSTEIVIPPSHKNFTISATSTSSGRLIYSLASNITGVGISPTGVVTVTISNSSPCTITVNVSQVALNGYNAITNVFAGTIILTA